jgi:hypothetical protein
MGLAAAAKVFLAISPSDSLPTSAAAMITPTNTEYSTGEAADSQQKNRFAQP